MVLRDHEQVEAMILIHSALSDDKRKVVNSVEAELTNMDLKSISAKSLPDPRTLQKSSHLLGSKVLQVNHTSLYFSLNFLVFCLIAEKIDEGKEKCGLSFATNSSSRRLLKLGSQKRRSWNKGFHRKVMVMPPLHWRSCKLGQLKVGFLSRASCYYHNIQPLNVAIACITHGHDAIIGRLITLMLAARVVGCCQKY
ncbi:uncharacterized protein LOC126594266 isoform X2 [Malus sylvestris]|uniref:uncharacterized protein LOC126594266 isoform X2 n=1 Tax=Malus sylvestris TaxID=3752 RepID=UPI0021AC5D35|nr:uncharacterized protein LOC126594266 isoform X2 [Malus sylvestris]